MIHIKCQISTDNFNKNHIILDEMQYYYILIVKQPRQKLNSLFTVSTPWCKELHHPHVVALQHHLVEVVVGELDHVLLSAAAALLLEGRQASVTSPILFAPNFR